MAELAEVAQLPDALASESLKQRLAESRPAAFLDYDGVLTPIVQRPEDAVMSESMRATVRDLATRCPVCVVTGRDRQVVQELMGIDDLIVAGSHGFDIWSPQGAISHDALGEFQGLVQEVTDRLRADLGALPGVTIEPKRASVAAHYRLAAEADRDRVRAEVESLLAEYPDQLKVTPGKMVFELQPKLDWNKGRAVLYLLDALGLAAQGVLPLYLGDDITDEDAFGALRERGIGILVGDPEDPEMSGRRTAADYRLTSVDHVEQFLASLAR